MKDLNEVLEFLDGNGVFGPYHRIGSTYTCSPAPTDTDTDYVVYANALLSEAASTLDDLGFAFDASVYPDSDEKWFSAKLRLDDGVLVNLIVTDHVSFYENSIKAADVCRALNLLDRKDRVLVHQIVVDGYTAEGIEKQRADAAALAAALRTMPGEATPA